MKPYYQDKWVTIYHGDCRKMGVREVPNYSIRTIFADPPFNVRKRYVTYMDNKQEIDYWLWYRKWLDICMRKLSDNGSIYIMALSRHLPNLFELMAPRGHFINLIIWRNISAEHSKQSFWNSYQPILLYSRTRDYLFNTYAQTRKGLERWVEFKNGAKGQLLDYWDDIPFVYAGSIHHPEAILKPLTNEKEHPTQMPLALAERAIIFSSNKGDYILDPFLGSGTTALAAKKLNRHCIGYEIEEKYCEIAANRCRQMVMEFNG